MAKKLNTATTIVSDELIIGDIEYQLEISVHGKQTDESFSHEFGIKEEYGQEVTGAELFSCKDEEDNEVFDSEILKQVNKHIEDKEFEDIEFDFSY